MVAGEIHRVNVLRETKLEKKKAYYKQILTEILKKRRVEDRYFADGHSTR